MNETSTGGSVTTCGYTLTSKPTCYKSKCDDCAYKGTCVNKDKDIPSPYSPYVSPQIYPYYPTITWCHRC